jgi:protein TonB
VRIQASRPPLHFAYPDDVHARGVVALTAAVDSDGAVRSVRIVSGNRALAAAAVRAVRHWRYRPYLKDGQPVATETNIVISFFANDAISMTFPPSIPASH